MGTQGFGPGNHLGDARVGERFPEAAKEHRGRGREGPEPLDDPLKTASDISPGGSSQERRTHMRQSRLHRPVGSMQSLESRIGALKRRPSPPSSTGSSSPGTSP